VDPQGRPRTDTFHADYPMIISTGVAYSGFERWLLAADVRYIDYRNTAGFRETGFAPNGALQGLGWRSIVAVSVGAQYRMTDRLALRGGYSFNQDPVPSELASVNIASAVIPEHTIYAGLTFRVSEALLLSATYLHVFDNAIEGPLLTPQGPVSGTTVRDQVSGADAFILGLTVQFGCRPTCDQ
jgi:long-chain fatty acid transport protein